MEVPDRPTDEPTVHTHRDHDLPTATDVALVIKNPNLAPHLVLIERWVAQLCVIEHFLSDLVDVVLLCDAPLPSCADADVA